MGSNLKNFSMQNRVTILNTEFLIKSLKSYLYVAFLAIITLATTPTTPTTPTA
jgi:hypothetical protein